MTDKNKDQSTKMNRRTFISGAAVVAAGLIAVGAKELTDGDSKPAANNTPTTPEVESTKDYPIPDPETDGVDLKAEADPLLVAAIYKKFNTSYIDAVSSDSVIKNEWTAELKNGKEEGAVFVSKRDSTESHNYYITFSRTYGDTLGACELHVTPDSLSYKVSGTDTHPEENPIKAHTNGEVLAVSSALDSVIGKMRAADPAQSTIPDAINTLREVANLQPLSL